MTATTAAAPAVVNLTIPIAVQRLRDLLCNAVEGGSTYWARFEAAERTPDLDYLRVRVIEHEAGRPGKRRVSCWITAEQLATGLQRLAILGGGNDALAQHFCDAIGGDGGDAGTADVVLQMAVFGELIYG
jgi:hypothetical protein